MFFNRKHKVQPDPLTVITGRMRGISEKVPMIRIAGVAPPGTDGNTVMEACFEQISRDVDIQSSPLGLLVYDMTDLRYEFGDYLGAYLWNLPALLDGVAILVVAAGTTRDNLESLRQYIGDWLPVGFYNSLGSILASIGDDTESFRALVEKRDACSQRGKVLTETGVEIVFHGSRQTGLQYRTGRICRDMEADLDCGVVGGPKELAIATVKMRSLPKSPQLDHPPTKTYSSVQEATDQGLYVVKPREG